MVTKDDLKNELHNTLKHCLGVLEDAENDPVKLQELKDIVVKLDFSGRDSDELPGPSRDEYSNPLLNAYYFTRYGMTYAFEYALMYDAILRDFYLSEHSSSGISVASFGCGAMIDAWSLAYAYTKLLQDNSINALELEYHGFDGAKWNTYFAGDNAGSYNAQGMPTDTCSCVNTCFKDMPWINSFDGSGAGVDIQNVFYNSEYRNMISDCNVLFFPKLLNELDVNKFNSIVSGMQDMVNNGMFKEKEIYLAISHSYNKMFNINEGAIGGVFKKGPSPSDDRDFAEIMVSALNCKCQFNVCGDVLERSPRFAPEANRLNYFKYRPAPDDFGSYDKNGVESQSHRAYEFCKIAGEYGPYSPYIYQIEPDFGGEVIKDIKCFDDSMKKHNIQSYKKMMSTATYIAMQIIKLTPKNRS